MMKLTKRQIEELEALAIKPRSTRNTRWDDDRSGRRTNCAKVQNNLMRLGLVYFCDEDGVRRSVSLTIVLVSYDNPRPQCRITDAGRTALAQLKDVSSKRQPARQ